METYYVDYLKHPIVLVGCGGIGSNLLPLLVKCGVAHLTLYDDDRVEPVNLAMQNFGPADFGHSKAEALAKTAHLLNPNLTTIVKEVQVHANNQLDGIVISAVDSMESRQSIFKAVCNPHSHVPLLIDGRLSRTYSDFFDLYAIAPEDGWARRAYEEWLEPARVTVKEDRPQVLSGHTPYTLSGFIGQILAAWVQKKRYPWKVTHYGDKWHTECHYAPQPRKVEHESNSER